MADRLTAAERLTPLEYMRRYGAVESTRGVGAVHEQPVPAGELDARVSLWAAGRGGVLTTAAGDNTMPSDGAEAVRARCH